MCPPSIKRFQKAQELNLTPKYKLVISEPRVRRRLVLELCSPLIKLNVMEDGSGDFIQSFSDIIIILCINY